ncbi:hypothetical protein M8494_05540 [Serratia ureilytica]
MRRRAPPELFVYPELRVSWDGQQSGPNKTRAFGRFTHPGSYSTTVTRPQLFRHYLAEQLAMLEHDYAAHIEVAPSQQEIPFPYVIDGSSLALDRSMSAGIAQHFPPPSWRRSVTRPPTACTTPPTAISRCRISMRCARISRWRGCGTTPARRWNTSSRSCCSPTSPAM